MRIILALLSALIGLALVFGGYRLARIVIPLLGFIAGISIGGAVIADMNSTPFLGTVLGVIVGLGMGLLLGLWAYVYYYIAVVVLGASLGYWAGSGVILLFGIDPGLLSALVGIALGAFVGLLAIISNAPKYVLIVLTSVAGAIATVGGVLLLFNQIPLEAYSYTAINVSLSHSFIWTLAALALWIVGMISQTTTSSDYEFREWTINGNENRRVPPTTTTHAPTH